jgi:hypothetical protein
LVVEQTALLASGPFSLLAFANDPGSGCGQILTHVIEIQEVGALLSEIIAELIDNPRRTVSYSMHVCFVVQPCS